MAFGGESGSSGSASELNPGYNGHESSGGLVYMRNRWYDPNTGRFTQEDPIGHAGGINLYGYVGNNPVSFSDPFGLCPPEDDEECPIAKVTLKIGLVPAEGRLNGAGVSAGAEAAMKLTVTITTNSIRTSFDFQGGLSAKVSVPGAEAAATGGASCNLSASASSGALSNGLDARGDVSAAVGGGPVKLEGSFNIANAVGEVKAWARDLVDSGRQAAADLWRGLRLPDLLGLRR
jgi:RHS repeat-associated protein